MVRVEFLRMEHLRGSAAAAGAAVVNAASQSEGEPRLNSGGGGDVNRQNINVLYYIVNYTVYVLYAHVYTVWGTKVAV